MSCQHRERFVAETNRFIAFCPYASRMPYEMWVLPRAHASHFENQEDADALAELALFLREMIRKLESLHGQLAYNYFIHTAPFDTSSPAPLSLAYRDFSASNDYGRF